MATGTSMTERMIGAAMLDVATYEDVEHDQTATGQAAAVVGIVAVARGIGSLGAGLDAFVAGILMAYVGWLLWSGITYVIGDELLGGDATWGEVLRAVGFAHTPGVLAVVAFVPLLGWLVALAASVWVLVAGFIGLRQALDLNNVKTLITVVLGWIAMVVVMAIPAMMFGAALA